MGMVVVVKVTTRTMDGRIVVIVRKVKVNLATVTCMLETPVPKRKYQKELSLVNLKMSTKNYFPMQQKEEKLKILQKSSSDSLKTCPIYHPKNINRKNCLNLNLFAISIRYIKSWKRMDIKTESQKNW